MIKKSLMATTVISMALSSAMAHAQGGYASASIGQADYDVPDVEFEKSTSFKLTGGYQINENFALEGSFINFGSAEDKEFGLVEIEGTGINMAAVGILPINDQFDLFAKAGMLFWDVEARADIINFYAEDDGSDLSVGVGAAFNASKQVSIIAEYEMFEVADEDLNNLSLGIRVNF